MTPQAIANKKRLLALKAELYGKSPIIASNRGPVEYQTNDNGDVLSSKGGGGVAVAVSNVNKYVDCKWISAAMSEGDRLISEEANYESLAASLNDQTFLHRFIEISDDVYNKHYNVFCNPFLWFFQHGMLDCSYNPTMDGQLWDSWEHGYIPANKAFADAVVNEAGDDELPVIMLHDYHLYLTAGYIRDKLPGALIQHFTHIPWPSPDKWLCIPRTMAKKICHGLCSCDIIGMQTEQDVHNFLQTCESILPEAEIDYQAQIIHFYGQEISVKAYPISVDVEGLKILASSEEVLDYKQRLMPLCGNRTIVRVDRLEPSKNILLGFEAFDMLLSAYPYLVGQVNFLAFLVPSRTEIKEYQDYHHKVFQMIDNINAKYGNSNWQPIYVFYEHNYAQAIAGMRLYDVLLVNSLADGMNLVAKEGLVVNARSGVLVLSEETGAHEQLKVGAISIKPTDCIDTMIALYDALTMSFAEKVKRSERLKTTITKADITQWFSDQLYDLYSIVNPLLQFEKIEDESFS